MYRIALLMLFGNRGRYLGMIVGLSFSALIMTQQPAIYFGLIDRTYSYIDEVNEPDIWVMDPTVQFVEENKAMRDTDLQRIRGITDIEWAVPLRKAPLYVLLPDGSRRLLEVSGIDDATLIGAPQNIVQGKLEDLRQQDAIIIDKMAAERRLAYRDDKGNLRPIVIGDEMEINDKRAVVVGIANMKPTFTLMPMAITTYSRAVSYSPAERRMLSYILVKAKPGADQKKIIRDIKAMGLIGYTAAEFKKVTSDYWKDNTGIPINFGIAILLGFAVGAAIAGQTFYGFVSENMKHYAALKAMGVQNSMLMKMVLSQAAIVGLIGYGIGAGISSIFGQIIEGTTLAFLMSPKLLLFSASGIALIVVLSALIAMRTVIRVDPAIVFRS